MSKTILILGPYCGDWETEMMLFRPYVTWVSRIVKCDTIFLATHSNRAFLYDWVSDDRFFPVYSGLSRDESQQDGITNDNLSQKDYFIIQKKIIQQILLTQDKGKHTLYNIFLNYTNRNIHYPYYKRIYDKIVVNESDKNNIIFIPDNSESERNIDYCYNKIKKHYDIKVLGDLKTYLASENEALKKVDYFETGYKYIVETISNAKLVICPLSHWTFICLLQGTPVISWVTDKNSKYYTLQSSEKCVILNSYNMENVSDMILSYMERMNNGV